jgi:hypothetical protein
MNKKSGVFISIIVVLVICLLYVFFSNRMYIRYLNDKVNDSISLLEEISEKDKKTFENNEKILSNVLVIDTLGLTCNLSSIIDKRTVVFNFSITNCSRCYEPIIELLKSYQDNNLIIIYNANNVRDLKFLLKEHVLKKMQVYYSPVTHKSLPADIENLPCFFVLDKNLEINNIYFPLKNEIDYIKEYLKITLNKTKESKT